MIICTFLIWSGEKGRGIEEWLLVSLIYSLSLFYLVQMKMQLLFFYFAREFSYKKEAGYGRTFQFRLLMFSFRVSLYKEQLVRKYTTARPKRVKTDGFLYRTLYVWFGDLFKTYFLQAADHLNVLKLVSFINIVD